MKKFTLRILLPSSNTTHPDQAYEILILCTHFSYSSAGNYEFIDNGNVVAYYPIRYTIIEKIEEIK